MKLPPEAPDTISLRSFPELSAEALLTNNPDPYTLHIDRGTALGTMLLTGFAGRSRFKKLRRNWQRFANFAFGEYRTFLRTLTREAKRCRQSRLKEYAGPGSYLVYRAEGELPEPLDLHAARRAGNIGFGFDLIKGETYREIHRRAVHSTSTALSLALADSTGSPATRFLSDIIYLTGPNGLVVYCKTITFGAAGIVTTHKNHGQAANTVNAIVPLLMQDEKLDGAVMLFVQSQKKSNDNLRAFIPAWSALELLINRLAHAYQAEWTALLANTTSPLPPWDKDLKQVPIEEYRMRDRFFAVACVLNVDSAAKDASEFNSINKKRGDYYHRMDVAEKDLPTHQAQSIFRKYLKLALDQATKVNA